MNNKELIYAVAFAEAKKLGIDNYNTQFLANMVLRKIRHPEEKMNEIATKVMNKMCKIYKNKKIVAVSSSKCLDQLQEKLDSSDNVPEELKNGKVVSRVVKKLAAEIIENLDEENFSNNDK